jgi:hypothetical protein
MGYERDRDHATRGPGAIAALDQTTGPRAARRVQAARATLERDRKMAAIERGALGRVDFRARGLDRRAGGGGRVTPPRPAAPWRPLVTAGNVLTGIRVAPPATSNPTAPQPPLAMPPPPPLPPPPAPIAETPITPMAPLPPVSAPSRTGSSGGGGGGVMPTGGTKIAPRIDPVAVDVPDVPESTPSQFSVGTAVVIGGAVIAAALLLRKRGGR